MSCIPFSISSIVTHHGPLLTSFIHFAYFLLGLGLGLGSVSWSFLDMFTATVMLCQDVVSKEGWPDQEFFPKVEKCSPK